MRHPDKSGRLRHMTKHRPEGRHTQTGDLLQAAARRMRRGMGEELAELDLTPAQSRALRIVLREDAPRLSTVAEWLRIAPRSATEVIDALEARGLVERCADPADRRASCVRPTDAGLAMKAKLDRARARASEACLAVLDDHDREQLHRILTTLEERS